MVRRTGRPEATVQLVDLDPVGNGTYDLIKNRRSGVWGYYFGQSTSAVTQLVNQYGRRIVDIEQVTNSTFDVILNHDLDARGTAATSATSRCPS